MLSVIDNEYISDGGSNDTGGEFKNQKEFSMDASLTILAIEMLNVKIPWDHIILNVSLGT